MTLRTHHTPLLPTDIPALERLLRCPEVYAFDGGMPSQHDFCHGMALALAGPPKARDGERWLHYGARLRSSGVLLGRLEATVQGNMAELGYQYGPAYWGQGYASEGLQWLHQQLHGLGVVRLWATVQPGNERSMALLERSGYARHLGPLPVQLRSYDDGDAVFGLRLA